MHHARPNPSPGSDIALVQPVFSKSIPPSANLICTIGLLGLYAPKQCHSTVTWHSTVRWVMHSLRSRGQKFVTLKWAKAGESLSN